MATTTGTDGITRVVSIGIARFADDARRAIPFAAGDARNFAERAFAAEGRSGTSTRLLTDANATTAAIGDALRSLVQTGSDDRLVVFLVSRATRVAGQVLLQTHDGEVPLGELLTPLWNGPAERVILLLDLQRGSEPAERLTVDDLSALFPIIPTRTLVMSDDGRNGSHVSGELQAGIWAAHVTAAFSAAAPRARRFDGTLTAGSLQAFLNDETGRSLSRAFTDGRRQSPVVLSATEEDVLDEPPAEAKPDRATPLLAGLMFASDIEIPVRSLGGFRKSLHSPPGDTLASSRSWVARLAEPDLAREMEETTARLRRLFGYKRRDLRADGPQEGAASVLTPDFAFHLVVQQHPERPDQAVLRRSLDRLRNLDVLERRGFDEAFPHGFQSLHVPSTGAFDLATIIDALEETEPSVVDRIDYPTDLSRIELTLAGFDGRIRIESSGLTILAAGPASPAELARGYAHVRELLT